MASPYIKDEAKMMIKGEARSSTYDSDASLKMFTPARMRSVDTPITPMSQPTQRNKSSKNSSVPLDEQTEKDKLKMRLATKSQDIKTAKDFLRDFPGWLNPKVSLIPEVGDWVEDIEAEQLYRCYLRAQRTAESDSWIYGSSGCGKSSVINALLNEERILPCNGLEACTAVAVEVAWNAIDEKSKAYRAEIQFITAEEWKAELDELIAELMSLDPAARQNPSGDDAKVAAAKIRAVYPHIAINRLNAASAAELMNDIVISKVLRKPVVIEMAAGQGTQFAAAIKPYIDSSLKSATLRQSIPYWPLVKIVRIFTRSPVLRTGLVLVDLPGSGDSNAAREMVAEEYMQRVSAICIVARIERALTNAVARDLFGRGAALKRRLLRSGLLDDQRTFFVLTHTDVINNDEFADGQSLEYEPAVAAITEKQRAISDRKNKLFDERKDCAMRTKQFAASAKDLAKSVETLQAATKTSNPQATKRKRNDNGLQSSASDTMSALADLQQEFRKKKKSHGDCRVEMKKLDQEEKDLEVEKATLDKNLTAICIWERSSLVTKRMKLDFSSSMFELEQEIENCGDGGASTSARLSSSELQNEVQTFCVCSKAYQIFHGRFAREQMPAGFNVDEDTSMPQLLQHCKEFTLKAREQLADAFLRDLTRLRARMRGWADNTTPDSQITTREKRLLTEALTRQSDLVIETVSESINSTMTQLQEDMCVLGDKPMKIASSAAAGKASFVFKKWSQDIIHHGTWKAICRRNGGVYKGKGKDSATYNWIDDLAEELTKYLDSSLRTLVNKLLPGLRDDYIAKIEDCTSKFPISLMESSMGITKFIANPLQNLSHNLERLQTEMLRVISSRFGDAIDMNRRVDRGVPPKIKMYMKSGYSAAERQKGDGALQKAKNVIKCHIEIISLEMYADAGKELADAVHNSVTVLRSHLEKDFNDYMDKIEKDFTAMLALARATPRPEKGPAKIALQREVLAKLSHFDELLGEFRSKDDETVGLDDPTDLNAIKDEDVKDSSGSGDGEDGLDDLDDLEDFNCDVADLDDPDSNSDGSVNKEDEEDTD